MKKIVSLKNNAFPVSGFKLESHFKLTLLNICVESQIGGKKIEVAYIFGHA